MLAAAERELGTANVDCGSVRSRQVVVVVVVVRVSATQGAVTSPVAPCGEQGGG